MIFGPHLHAVGVAAGEAAAVGGGRGGGELRVRGQQRPLGRPLRVGLVLGAVLLVILRLVTLRHGGVTRHRPVKQEIMLASCNRMSLDPAPSADGGSCRQSSRKNHEDGFK